MADAKALAELKKRTLCAPRKLPYYEVAKGEKFSTTIEKLETDLTVEMLQSCVDPVVDALTVQRVLEVGELQAVQL